MIIPILVVGAATTAYLLLRPGTPSPPPPPPMRKPTIQEVEMVLPTVLPKALGVRVEEIPGEFRQFYVYAPQGSVDFSKIGKVHQDLGYAVGVTLENGLQIGFRYAKPR